MVAVPQTSNVVELKGNSGPAWIGGSQIVLAAGSLPDLTLVAEILIGSNVSQRPEGLVVVVRWFGATHALAWNMRYRLMASTSGGKMVVAPPPNYRSQKIIRRTPKIKGKFCIFRYPPPPKSNIWGLAPPKKRNAGDALV